MDKLVWIWTAAGVLMILAELFIPGFIIFFFGVSALLVALLSWMIPIPFSVQLLLFAIFGVLLLLICRKYFPKIFRGVSKEDRSDIDGDDVAGSAAVVVEEIVPPLAGKIDFRGSLWEGESSRRIPKGSVVRILRRKNLTLVVEPAENKH